MLPDNGLKIVAPVKARMKAPGKAVVEFFFQVGLGLFSRILSNLMARRVMTTLHADVQLDYTFASLPSGNYRNRTCRQLFEVKNLSPTDE